MILVVWYNTTKGVASAAILFRTSHEKHVKKIHDFKSVFIGIEIRTGQKKIDKVAIKCAYRSPSQKNKLIEQHGFGNYEEYCKHVANQLTKKPVMDTILLGDWN